MEELREGLLSAKCTLTVPGLSQLLFAAFPHAPALKLAAVGRTGRYDRPELGSLLSSPHGMTVPSLCFLSTAEAQVDTMVFLIRKAPDFGIPC